MEAGRRGASAGAPARPEHPPAARQPPDGPAMTENPLLAAPRRSPSASAAASRATSNPGSLGGSLAPSGASSPRRPSAAARGAGGAGGAALLLQVNPLARQQQQQQQQQQAGGAGEADPAPAAQPQPQPVPAPAQRQASLSAKEWARLRAAAAQSEGLRGSIVGSDGRVGVPVGWVKVAGSGGGFVREADGRAAASVDEVLALLEAEG